VLANPLKRGAADCDLHLPEAKSVTVRLELGKQKPIDWVAQMHQA
jgi:hypothetical protein